jgi:hypothetical protein
MWPFRADSDKRLRAAASVLSWRLDEVRAVWRAACRGGVRDVSRALSMVERTLDELASTDLDAVDGGRSARLFDLIERANLTIDRVEARIDAVLGKGSGADVLTLRPS